MSDNVARGTMLGIAGQAWHLLTAFLLYAFLARRLGPVLFGQWRVVLSVLMWFELFVNSGIASLAAKSISETPEKRVDLAHAAYAVQLLVGLSVFGAIVLGAGWVARLLSNPGLAPLLRVAALDIPVYSALLVTSAVVLGLKRFERQAVAWVVYATAKAAAIAVLVAAGFSVAGALIGNALSSVAGLAVVIVPAARGGRGLAPRAGGLALGMLVASVPFLVLSLLDGLGQNVGLWTVSSVMGNAALVGLYSAAVAIAEVPVFLFLGLNRVILPAVASAGAEGDRPLARHYVTQAVRLALIVTVLGVALIAANGRQVIALIYSTSYLGAFLPLVVLMIAAVGQTVVATCTQVLMAQNRARLALGVLAGALALQVALLGVLAPRFGILGAAAATASSALVASACEALVLRGSLGSRPVATLARCVVAGAVVAVALAYASPSPLAVVPAFALAAVAYLAVLGILREFDALDVASVKNALWKR